MKGKLEAKYAFLFKKKKPKNLSLFVTLTKCGFFFLIAETENTKSTI